MEQAKIPDKDIKILAGLGVIAIVLFLAAPILFVAYAVKESARLEQCKTRSAKDAGCQPGFLWPVIQGIEKGATLKDLGEKGSVCGGPSHLPCKPGFTCSMIPTSDVGVCIPD